MTTRPYALITGASSGIGAAMARLAANNGFDVGLVARRADRLSVLAQNLESRGAKADIFVADLARPGMAVECAERVLVLRRVPSLLVNNAGSTVADSFANAPMAEQERFIELTVKAPVVLTRMLLPSMIEAGHGRIINIGSITALSSGAKGNTLYPAGKSFLLKFSQSLNAEVKRRGVFVTAVLPGFVATEFQAANGLPVERSPLTQHFAQSAEQVANEAWRRNAKGHEIVVPGAGPKCAAALMRVLPEPIMRNLTRAAAEKYYVGD